MFDDGQLFAVGHDLIIVLQLVQAVPTAVKVALRVCACACTGWVPACRLPCVFEAFWTQVVVAQQHLRRLIALRLPAAVLPIQPVTSVVTP
jgi:hypothetical protein